MKGYLNNELFPMKNIVAEKKKVRVQMPAGSMKRLNDYVKGKII